MAHKHIIKPRLRGLILSGLTALCLTATPAAAQTFEDYFKSYQAAYARGDIPAAIAEGKKAWDAAETALSDHELTAILAYNYGSLVITQTPQDAVKALKRAKKLSAAIKTGIPVNQIEAYLAYARYADAPNQKTLKPLYEALYLLPTDNGAPKMDDAFMWLNLARTEAGALRLWNAEAAAKQAIKSIETANLEDASRPALNHALIIRAAAGLSGRERTPERIAWALDDLDRVFESIGPQDGADNLDPVLAAAFAWRRIALKELADQGAAVPADYAQDWAMFKSARSAPKRCNINWEKSPQPNFSGSGVFPGYVGAAVIAYDISKTGDIQNPRLAAQVPNASLGRAAMRSFKKWKLSAAPAAHEACHKDQLQAFIYHAEWPPQ